MTTFAEMVDGPKHDPHGTQTQVGWLGQTGAFYPWREVPTREQEPGSFAPVYIDDEENTL